MRVHGSPWPGVHSHILKKRGLQFGSYTEEFIYFKPNLDHSVTKEGGGVDYTDYIIVRGHLNSSGCTSPLSYCPPHDIF